MTKVEFYGHGMPNVKKGDLPGKFILHMLAQKKIPYPECSIPDLLPAHVRKLFAMQFKLDLLLDAAFSDKLLIGLR